MGIFPASQGDGSNQVHSDQMVLATVRWGAGPKKRWPKVLKTKLTQGGPSGLSPLCQIVLMMARWEVGGGQRHSKESRKTTLGSQGT
jgi:hypothetical protein